MAKIDSFRGLGALVTGASSGIGREIALGLAADGARLVLVARRADRLEALREEAKALGAPEAHVLPADLSRAEEPARVAAEAERLLGEVDILVNNAGRSVPGSFSGVDLERTLEILRLNCHAPIALARLLLPGMLRRNRGGILTVASLAGVIAAPYTAAYAGTKAFLLVWSNSLHQEVKHTRVAVTALCPGVTDTEFFAAAGYGADASKFLKHRADPAKVARAGLRGLRKGKMEVVPGPLNRLLFFAPRLTTRRFAASVSRRLMSGRPPPRPPS